MNSAVLAPLAGDRLMADRVRGVIAEAIVAGQLKPGERLIEARLAEQLAVSRSPVREALRRLALEGLVVGQPHRGFRVTSLSRDDVIELYALRAALEALAAKLAVRGATPAIVQRLGAIVESMRTAAHRGDIQRMAILDMSFHEIVGEASSNGRLIRILRSLRLQIRESIAINLIYDNPADVVAQHEQLLAALQARKPAEFGRLMEAHISAAGDKAIRGLAAIAKAARTEATRERAAHDGARHALEGALV